MSFFAFVARYYAERLHWYEHLDLTRCAEAALLDIAGEASALHKFLIDILEEGYTATVHRLVGQTDACNRLQQFLSTVLVHLGGSSERQRFYLTQVLMTEMVAFLHWICTRLAQPVPVVPVPLLRDTLLIHLGLTWLRRSGVPIPESQPAIIGRKFADLCGDGRAIHGALGKVLYRVLMEDRPRDLATLQRHFATAVSDDPAIPAPFTQACRDYLATLMIDGTPLFIESGVQGTFPLFLLSLTANTGEMLFYTTTPWLYPTYAQIVFRKNYNYLREMETIVGHDY